MEEGRKIMECALYEVNFLSQRYSVLDTVLTSDSDWTFEKM